MLRRGFSVAGSVVGWVGAVANAATDILPPASSSEATMVLLSVAITCTASCMLQRFHRPLGAAYDLGYETGRRDAIRDATQRSSVSPIRRVPNGLSAFNRTSAGA